MADAPAAPAAKTNKALAPKALKTFIWSAKKEDDNITFLKGERVKGFPTSLIADYRKRGLIAPEVKEED